MSDGATLQTYYFPNKMGRIVLLAMEEVMGKNGLNAILNLARLQHLSSGYPPADFELAFAFDEMARLFQGVDEMYGPRGGRMLSLRIGRGCFKHGVTDFGAVLGVADLAFRVAPLALSMRVTLEVLNEIFNRYSEQRMALGEDRENFYWIAERCGFCWGQQSSRPVCAVMVGLLQESLYWVSRGGHFDIEEITCAATGADVCTLRIGKQPFQKADARS